MPQRNETSDHLDGQLENHAYHHPNNIEVPDQQIPHQDQTRPNENVPPDRKLWKKPKERSERWI
jgi:hypothetical protein